MMVRGQVAASAVFSVTSYMNLIKMGVDPDKDVRWLFYSDYGLELYSNGIMVSHKLLAENPKAVAGLVRAANRAQVECAANPDPCLDSLIHEQPLLQKDVERRRFDYSFYGYTLTPETEKIGLGDVDDKRMLSSIDTIVESYGLPRKPMLKEVFDRSFLPPLADRLVKPHR
jgi:NitT/TauT family transport system substrate-binding protein